ncbi:MAG: serine/threonine protein kinase, partial [Planctomycetales bacterium]
MQDTLPQQFGDYVVREQLGVGGGGAVYKAQHARMDRTVAIKVLNKNAISSQDAVERFQREMKASAQLNHPNIVTSHDAGEQDGWHYLVLEFVSGLDLERLVEKKGPLPVKTGVELLKQAATGLAYAHSKGIIHRDVKPANLILDDEETIKILDLGLARLTNQDKQAETGLTQTNTVMGTASYMAPEQAMRLKDADSRADIYSLGCTMH